jgi:hypothetical protein
MLKQSRALASCSPLVPLWEQLKVTAHLAERTTIQMQYATRFSEGLPAWRRDKYTMQTWCEHVRPRWSAKERCLMYASVSSEGITDSTDLIALTVASFALFINQVRGSQQEETKLSQK